jgi:hypothetical protein
VHRIECIQASKRREARVYASESTFRENPERRRSKTSTVSVGKRSDQSFPRQPLMGLEEIGFLNVDKNLVAFRFNRENRLCLPSRSFNDIASFQVENRAVA